MISVRGIEFIKQFEGFSATPYFCCGGHWTIGYGHIISPKENYEYVTVQQATQILRSDLLQTEQIVIKYVDIELLWYQFDALVSFIFNCGGKAFRDSTLRKQVNAQLYEAAGAEFLRWAYVKGALISGLARRRKAESKMFLGC